MESLLETIHLKPSTEILPDQYIINNPNLFLVQIIYNEDYSNDAQILADTLKDDCKFNVTKQLFTTQKEFSSQMKSFVSKITSETPGVLTIILCKGSFDVKKVGKLIADDGEISFFETWQEIIDLDHLRGKPKLFLFQTHVIENTQTDGITKNPRLYNVPAPGADLLIIVRNLTIHACIEDQFMQNFCQHVKQHGELTDILEIITFSTTVQRPLIVSTLTARFFFKKAEYRDTNYTIMKNLEQLELGYKK